MALDALPLDDDQLSPAVKNVMSAAAPPQMKLAVAKGIAPLPPVDLATALYQIAHTPGPDGQPGELAATAAATAKGLPDRLVTAALAAPAIDPRVIDFLARQLVGRPVLVEQILLGRATADETFAYIATVGDEAQLELIGRNEARLLRYPAIIAALYHNPKTRMSTATRSVELAIRNNVRVEGIATFEELKDAILDDRSHGKETTDEAFEAAVEKTEAIQAQRGGELDDDADIEAQIRAADEKAAEAMDPESISKNPANAIKNLSTAGKVRLATLGNGFARSILIRDKSRVVVMAVIRSPTLTENEVVRFAGNRELHEDVIRYIARQREWTRLYAVKRNLVNNPKTPLPASMSTLPFLTAKDLLATARSKGIPSALAKAAQALVSTRTK